VGLQRHVHSRTAKARLKRRQSKNLLPFFSLLFYFFFSCPAAFPEKAGRVQKMFRTRGGQSIPAIWDGARAGTAGRVLGALLLLRFYACSHMANVLGHGYTT